MQVVAIRGDPELEFSHCTRFQPPFLRVRTASSGMPSCTTCSGAGAPSLSLSLAEKPLGWAHRYVSSCKLHLASFILHQVHRIHYLLRSPWPPSAAWPPSSLLAHQMNQANHRVIACHPMLESSDSSHILSLVPFSGLGEVDTTISLNISTEGTHW